MRGLLWSALALLACNQPTTLLLDINGPSSLTSVDFAITLATGGSATRTLPLSAGETLPGRAVVELPDIATLVTIDLTGHEAGGGTLETSTSVTSQPHQQLTVSMTLGTPMGDLGGDGGSGVLVPRLITNAYYSDYSGTTYKSPAGMSHTGFSVDTAGIVDGDLVLFIASIDNGSTMLWPNPIAPGYTQLAQTYYGNDGQTFVVSWKIASGEPAMYSGTYGSGAGSSSATITLIAVAGANPSDPINTYLSSFDPGADISPVVGSSVGVNTTVSNCAIIYASGTDWGNLTGSNTFTPPTGYTSLAEIGDRGGSNWDWTSQQVAYKIQPAAGATGTVTGSMLGNYSGTAWTVLIAVAPR